MSEITEAADAVLRPLGLKQRGRSGVFIGDHGFWIAIVEFKEERQLLTVGAHWLWYVQSRRCFDYGRRLAFDRARPREMAVEAAETVTDMAARFASVAQIAREVAAPGDESWPLYHAGVAAGLAGETDAARRVFAQLAGKTARPGWETELQRAGAALAPTIDDPAVFRTRVAAIVERTRALQGLPAMAVRFD